MTPIPQPTRAATNLQTIFKVPCCCVSDTGHKQKYCTWAEQRHKNSSYLVTLQQWWQHCILTQAVTSVYRKTSIFIEVSDWQGSYSATLYYCCVFSVHFHATGPPTVSYRKVKMGLLKCATVLVHASRWHMHWCIYAQVLTRKNKHTYYTVEKDRSTNARAKKGMQWETNKATWTDSSTMSDQVPPWRSLPRDPQTW